MKLGDGVGANQTIRTLAIATLSLELCKLTWFGQVFVQSSPNKTQNQLVSRGKFIVRFPVGNDKIGTESQKILKNITQCEVL